MKTRRQPTTPPRKLPNGAAITRAIETAPKKIESALGMLCPPTRRIIREVEIAQKPPSASPRKARPSNNMAKFTDRETNILESSNSTAKATTTYRLFRPPINLVTSRLANIATSAVEVTDCPASPSETSKSSAIGVSRLTGKNSAIIRHATQNATAKTAIQSDLTVAVHLFFSFINSFLLYFY